MKMIVGLSQPIKDVRGKPVRLEPEADATARDGLVQFAATYRGNSAKNDVKMMKLAQTLIDHDGDTWLVENAEHELLQEAVEQNRAGYPAMVRAPVYAMLQNAKEVPKQSAAGAEVPS